MPTTPESSGAHGPRKRTLSTKAATNGDPIAEKKRKKSEEVQRKGATTALTQKKLTTTTKKNKIAATKKAASSSSAKQAPRRPSIEIEEVYDEADHHTSVPPRNPRHILEAADGSDDDMDDIMDDEPAPELITIDDDDEDIEVVHEAPEESAEAELRMWHY
jgi:hypothetical protein